MDFLMDVYVDCLIERGVKLCYIVRGVPLDRTKKCEPYNPTSAAKIQLVLLRVVVLLLATTINRRRHIKITHHVWEYYSVVHGLDVR